MKTKCVENFTIAVLALFVTSTRAAELTPAEARAIAKEA